jgi:hypothetical protein
MKTGARNKAKGPAKPRGRGAIPADTDYQGAHFNEQDVKRRLGNFVGAGEHARQGGRTTGIVGQTKQKNRTDKKSRK